jgi:hypothetical protein
MNKADRTKVSVTPDSIRKYAESLVKIAGFHADLATLLEKHGIEEVQTGNLKTAVLALVGLGRFSAAIIKGAQDMRSIEGLEQIDGAVMAFIRAQSRKAKDVGQWTKAEKVANNVANKVLKDTSGQKPGQKPKK